MNRMKNHLKKAAPFLAAFAAGTGATLMVVSQINRSKDTSHLFQLDDEQELLLSVLPYANEEDRPVVYRNHSIWVPDSVTMHNAGRDDISL